MSYSTQRVVSDGSLVLLSVSIGYLERSHIHVFFNDVENDLPWSWVGLTDNQIAFSPAVPNGVEVLVARKTDLSEPYHIFTQGAQFTAKSLDEDIQQVLFIAQEATEQALTGDFYQNVNMHGFGIKNAADAVDPQDLITLSQAEDVVEAVMGPYVAAASASAAASATSAAASAASASASANSATASAASATASASASANSATASAASATAALASEIAAAASASTAATKPGGLRNRIINGDMRIWQRGVSFTAPINTHSITADRWVVAPNGANVTVAQGGDPVTSNLPGSLVATGAVGNTGMVFQQRIEAANAHDLAVKRVTLSFYVYGNATSGVSVQPSISTPSAKDNFTTTTLVENGPSFPVINGAFTRYTYTFSVSPGVGAVNGLLIQIGTNALGAGQSVGIASVQLEEGLIATPFEMRPIGFELSLCQRYYEAGFAEWAGYQLSGSGFGQLHPYKVTKRVSPTLVWSVVSAINVTSPTIGAAGTLDSFKSLALAASTGVVVSSGNWTASAEL